MNLQTIHEWKMKEPNQAMIKLKTEEESNKWYTLTQNGFSQMIVMTAEVQDSSTTSTNLTSQTSKRKRKTRKETRIIALSFETEKKGPLRGMRGISTWKRQRWK